MTEIPRLNGVIRALESGKPAIMAFGRAEREDAMAFGGSGLDGVLYEMEHQPWDPFNLRDALYYMTDRRRIVTSGSLAPAVTPMVRIPANGAEKNQFLAKQGLDVGCYGICWPHVSTVEEAMNAVASCRYPRPKDADHYHPAGHRGDAPNGAARYWGLTTKEYYARADVWPLVPHGEIFVIVQIEDTLGIDNLADILKEVPGIGAILIGEGDLSQELGHPRDVEQPIVKEAMATIRARCHEAGVVVGHPHVTAKNVGQVIEDGYRLMFTAPTRSFANLDAAMAATGRS